MTVLWSAFVVALLTVLSITPAVAEPERGTFKDDPSSGEEAGGCTQTGVGQAFFRTCTSSVGTLTEVKSPAGAGDLIQSEGYAICSAFGVHGVETTFGSSGLGFPTISTQASNVRTTTDGIFRITQSFLRDTLEKEIIITVTVRNMSAVPVAGVRFSRFFDVDVTDQNDFSGATKESAFIWDRYSGDPGRGLELGARTYTIPSEAHIVRYVNFLPLSTGCNPGVESGNPGAFDDWTARVTYNIGTIAAGASKIMKFVYRMM